MQKNSEIKKAGKPEDLQWINDNTERGDVKLIHRMTGFTSDYIQDCLNPENCRKNERVFEAARDVIKNRQLLLQKYAN